MIKTKKIIALLVVGCLLFGSCSKKNNLAYRDVPQENTGLECRVREQEQKKIAMMKEQMDKNTTPKWVSIAIGGISTLAGILLTNCYTNKKNYLMVSTVFSFVIGVGGIYGWNWWHGGDYKTSAKRATGGGIIGATIGGIIVLSPLGTKLKNKKKEMIIETHAHMSDVKFDEDREAVIQRAFDSGVGKIISISCEMCYWDKTLELLKYDNIFMAFGIHPNAAWKGPPDYGKLETLIQNKKCVAVGECGLDYHYDASLQNIVTQKQSLVKQLELAAKYNKPVIIHCRDACNNKSINAYDDMIDFLRKYKLKGVIHGFEGNLDQAKEFVEMGFMLGIGGPVTYSDILKQVVSKTDISKLLTETDSPYCPSQRHRKKRNEPSYIVEVAEEIATLKRVSVEKVWQITTQNAEKLFRMR